MDHVIPASKSQKAARTDMLPARIIPIIQESKCMTGPLHTESANPIHCYKRKQPQTEKLLVHHFFMKGFTKTTDPNIYPFAYFHSNRGSFSPAILANPPLKGIRLKSTHSINTPYQLPLYPSMNTHFRPTIRSPGHSSECTQNRIQLSSISILHIAAALHLHVLT